MITPYDSVTFFCIIVDSLAKMYIKQNCLTLMLLVANLTNTK